MVKYCFVCKEKYQKNDELSFHKVPKNYYMRKAWLEALGVEESHVTSEYSYICSNHFQVHDFIIKPSGRRYLKDTSIPRSISKEAFSVVDSAPGFSKENCDLNDSSTERASEIEIISKSSLLAPSRLPVTSNEGIRSEETTDTASEDPADSSEYKRRCLPGQTYPQKFEISTDSDLHRYPRN